MAGIAARFTPLVVLTTALALAGPAPAHAVEATPAAAPAPAGRLPALVVGADASTALECPPPTLTAQAIPTTAPRLTDRSALLRDPCRAVGAGRVEGLRSRPAHVTLALAAKHGDTAVTVVECRRVTRSRYVQSWAVAGHVGRAGFAPRGAKREGDGRTPTGVFGFGTAFGAGDPGSRTGYLRLRPNSCWGSTVGSARYNTYFRGVCGPADERMFNDVKGAYAQGMLIDYNTAPVRQGLGSAIFFHVSTGGATAGCVSVPASFVTAKIRGTRPGDVIAMGVVSDVIRR